MKTRFLVEWSDARAVEAFAFANGYGDDLVSAARDRGPDIHNRVTYEAALNSAALILIAESDFFGEVSIQKQRLDLPSEHSAHKAQWSDDGEPLVFDDVSAVEAELSEVEL